VDYGLSGFDRLGFDRLEFRLFGVLTVEDLGILTLWNDFSGFLTFGDFGILTFWNLDFSDFAVWNLCIFGILTSFL